MSVIRFIQILPSPPFQKEGVPPFAKGRIGGIFGILMRRYAINLLLLSIIIILVMPLLAFAQLPDPLGGMGWTGLLTKIGNYILQIAMAAAVIAIIWSGILFMTAGGKEDRVTQARKTFLWAIIGLAVVLVGMGIVALIKDVLGGR